MDSGESKTDLGSNKAKCFLPEMKPLELQTNFDPTLWTGVEQSKRAVAISVNPRA